MKIEKVKFRSAGLTLDGSFYVPDGGAAAGKPFILSCSGFQGLNDIHPARFARTLTPHGYPCFGFDYRGFAESEGERGHVVLEEQVEDIVNAATFVRSRPESQGRPLVLIGWGMAGGLILQAAKQIPDLAGVVCLNGFYDGERVQKALRGETGWETWKRWLEEKKRTAPDALVDPFDIYPLDKVTVGYVDGVLRTFSAFGENVKLDLADSLLRFKPEQDLAHLAGVPAFIGHGEKNELHPAVEAKSLHDRYPGPKTAYWVPQGGHTEWMLDDDPKFIAMMDRVEKWLAERR